MTPVLTADDSPATVARAILDFFNKYPDAHNQRVFVDAKGAAFTPEDSPACGTTLCVAGAGAHLLGYTLDDKATFYFSGDLPPAPAVIVPPNTPPVTRRALGLTQTAAFNLFYESTNNEALTYLALIADGTAPAHDFMTSPVTM